MNPRTKLDASDIRVAMWIDPRAGTEITHAAEDAIHLAGSSGNRVYFTHNDRTVYADPGDDLSIVWRRWASGRPDFTRHD